MGGPNFNHIKYYTVTPALDTSAYAAADQMGAVNTITDCGAYTKNLELVGLTVIDKDKEKGAFDILFFRASPTVASSDNAALNITDAQMATNFIGHVSILATDYVDISASSIATLPASRLGLRLEMDSDDLYCLLRAASAPTYTAASDLVIKLAFKSG